MTLPVSVIILANQDNVKLRNAIGSVRWATEIIVVWCTKEQPSERLAKEIGVTLVQHPSPITDFAQTRNRAFQTATQEWVFFLDSDEVMTHDSVAQLQRVIGLHNVDGVRVLRHDIFHGHELKWGELYNVRIVRLFRKHKGHFVRAVHEVAIIDGKVIDSPIFIKHYAHDSLSQFLQKITYYAQLEAQLRVEAGEHFSLFQLLFFPKAKFFVNYFLKLGFLDGWAGLCYATMMSIHSFAVRALLYEKK